MFPWRAVCASLLMWVATTVAAAQGAPASGRSGLIELASGTQIPFESFVAFGRNCDGYWSPTITVWVDGSWRDVGVENLVSLSVLRHDGNRPWLTGEQSGTSLLRIVTRQGSVVDAAPKCALRFKVRLRDRLSASSIEQEYQWITWDPGTRRGTLIVRRIIWD